MGPTSGIYCCELVSNDYFNSLIMVGVTWNIMLRPSEQGPYFINFYREAVLWIVLFRPRQQGLILKHLYEGALFGMDCS
jgi:hypothetical protein